MEKKKGETARDAANHFKNFPTVDSVFGDDFTVLPTFVPTDTLERLKNCRKYARKSADAVADFGSSKGHRMLSFLFTTSKCMRVQIPRMMLYTLRRFAGPPIVNLINISYMS